MERRLLPRRFDSYAIALGDTRRRVGEAAPRKSSLLDLRSMMPISGRPEIGAPDGGPFSRQIWCLLLDPHPTRFAGRPSGRGPRAGSLPFKGGIAESAVVSSYANANLGVFRGLGR